MAPIAVQQLAQLQWGRLVIEAESDVEAEVGLVGLALQWGRLVIEAESGRDLHDRQPHAVGFNGAAS